LNLKLRHPFEQRLIEIRRRIKPEPFDWYPFDSIANITQLEALLPKGMDSVLELAGDEPVADIGAGDGDMAFLLESLGCDVTAIDWPGTNANAMLGLALLRRELQSSIGIREIEIDEQFRLDGERFGLVLSLGLLYHLKNPFYFLEKLAFHSRYCVFSTRILPRDKTNQAIAYLTADREFNNDETNFWFFSESGILRLIDRCGWNVTATKMAGNASDTRFFWLAESRIAKTKPIIRILNGWHKIENRAWRWTEREFGAVIENMEGATRLEFRFHITPDLLRISGDMPGISLSIEAWVDGVSLGAESFRTAGAHVFTRPISPAPRRCEVKFRLSHTFPEQDNDRQLGVIVRLPNNTIIDENCGLRLYSKRRASIGSSREAFRAGSHPANRPIISSTTVEVTTANCEMCRWMSPLPESSLKSGPSSGKVWMPAVTAQPSSTPNRPPIVTIAIASARNCQRIAPRVAPSDFRMPISFVRCVTDTSMMLARPTPPIASVRAPISPSRI
jgi:tRNA (mo5U34)-methyltransferase